MNPQAARTGTSRFGRLLLALLTAHCSTLGTEGLGNVDLPRTGVGPFRRLERGEVLGEAPFVLRDPTARYRQPAVLQEASADTTSVVLFATARLEGGEDGLVRTRADDARTFFGSQGHFGKKPPVVLRPTEAWESGNLAKPVPLRFAGKVWLYYLADGKVGVATSDDGFVFTKPGGPVVDPARALGRRASSLGGGALSDGVHLFVAIDGALFEWFSSDGRAFTLLDANPATPELDPVLRGGPVEPVAGAADAAVPRFDGAGVTDPCVTVRRTDAGREHVRVLYTGRAADGTTSIGFAARYGVSGPLTRNEAPVYAVGKGERAPAVVHSAGFDMLFVEEDVRGVPQVSAAVAPVSTRFAEPAEFPERP